MILKIKGRCGNTNSFIKFQNVSYNIKNENHKKNILENINFEISKGEFISVLGNNGSGKSTLAKHFNATLTPSEGNILIDGLNTRNPDLNFDIKKKVSLVFQNPDNQIIAETVEEEIAFGMENLCVEPKEMQKRIKKALSAVNMEDFQEAPIYALSGGQKQRINIAGAIAVEPEILVLDEPTSMLDPQGKSSVLKLISKLNKERKITIILITHSMEEALLSSKTLMIHEGKVSFFGSPKEFFSNETFLKNHSLDIMQSAELLTQLKKRGYNVCASAFEDFECTNEIIKLLETHK